MSGRGCTVEVRLLSYDHSENEDVMSLPVALHSPLDVLKDLLANITSIPPNDQVLILCDLNDPDRNNDVLLEENTSLSECGIDHGSVLTLHGLGMDNDVALKKRKATLMKKNKEQVDPTIKHLNTDVPPEQADHSYNGVIFGVKSNDAHAIEVTSIHIGGMLGRVRVFARDRPWNVDNDDAGHSMHYWAYRDLPSETGWTLVADQICRPSWDRLTEIKFDIPLCLLPHECKALYCHSGLPDDLGIQYQSYRRKNEVFAKDEHVSLLAGLGHTGSEPFETENGWYRNWRGMSGRISYRCTLKGWTPWEHSIFPKELKEGVMAMLLTYNRAMTTLTEQHQQQRESSMAAMGSASHSTSEEDLAREEEEAMMAADEGATVTTDANGADAPLMRASSLESVESNASTLSVIDYGTLYHIMEFMHWDWFEEAKNVDSDEEEDETRPQGTAVQGQRITLADYNSLQAFFHSMVGSSDDSDDNEEGHTGGMSAEQQSHYMHSLLAQLVGGGGIFGSQHGLTMGGGGVDDDDENDDDDDDDSGELDDDNDPNIDDVSIEYQEEEQESSDIGDDDDDTVEIEMESSGDGA